LAAKAEGNEPEGFVIAEVVPAHVDKRRRVEPLLDNDDHPRRDRDDVGRLRRQSSTTGNRIAPVFLAIGIPLICIGLGLILFFCAVYDTTVPVHWDFWVARVHNIGLMQNRLIGTLVGIVSLAAGIALTVIGGVAGRKR
jgi:hypothetical protein